MLFKAASAVIFGHPHKFICSKKVGLWIIKASVSVASCEKEEQAIFPYLKGNCEHRKIFPQNGSSR